MSVIASLRRVRAKAVCACFSLAVATTAIAEELHSEDSFQITPQLNDAWYNPETAGQGFFISVLPQANIVFLSWFTYDTDEASEIGSSHFGESNHRWLTAQGPITGDTSEMVVYITSGGQFDSSSEVENRADGTITLSFENCNSGTVDYDIPSINRQGSIPIQRVVTDNIDECEGNSPAVNASRKTRVTTHAGTSNKESSFTVGSGLSDAWYNPVTAGQGYFISVLPKTGIVFLSWFTYDTDEATDVGTAHFGEPNHRWITAQGPIDGNGADLTVYTTSGGLFDHPTEVQNTESGTMRLSFSDCNSGSVEYDLPDIDRQGTVPIQRVVPDNMALCEAQNQTADSWAYWKHEDVKVLDNWGERFNQSHDDLIALYLKEEADHIALRVDYMDLASDSLAPTYFGLDFSSGGVSNVIQGNGNPSLDIDWDVLIVAEDGTISAFDSSFTELQGVLSNPKINRRLDYFSVDVSKSALTGWDGGELSMQALVTNSNRNFIVDDTSVAKTSDVAGKAKLVLPFMNAFSDATPAGISWYDGYELTGFHGGDRRGGLKYLLDAAEKYQLPVVITDLRLDRLSGHEYLGLMDRFRSMNDAGTLTMSSNMIYGHFMSWWPQEVDENVIQMAKDMKARMDAPVSEVFYPYEAILTPADIEIIRNSGYKAIWGLDQYYYWFGFIENWSDPKHVSDKVRALRKIHRINDMDFFFDSLSFDFDERWETPDWSQFSYAWLSQGTDEGLHAWFRRTLVDMATSDDQQQLFTFGTDLGLTDWMYEEVADRSFEWLASHPWIEVTNFDDLASRGWSVVDHGTLDLEPDELLIQHELEGDGHYNAYLPLHYYGGTANGHSPIVAEGEWIESYFDLIPILRDGQPIPSGRIMGDYKTPGSIIYETIENLLSAPSNKLSELAWRSFHTITGENTYHEGAELASIPKARANYTGHVNKIIAAAEWAEAAARGDLSSNTVVNSSDLDLDGEDEYTMHNDQVFAIFENDGGRLEYAFAFDDEIGAVQLIAPFNQDALIVMPEGGHDAGEPFISEATGGRDTAFIDQRSDTGEFDYSVMSADVANDELTFTSADNKVSKTFTLSADTLAATYSTTGLEYLNTGFGFVTNLDARFEPNWGDNWSFVEVANERYGWKNAGGGYSVVNLLDTEFRNTTSFLDSPVPPEMSERQNSESYPGGHYMPFPYGYVQTASYRSNFSVSITLRANP